MKKNWLIIGGLILAAVLLYWGVNWANHAPLVASLPGQSFWFLLAVSGLGWAARRWILKETGGFIDGLGLGLILSNLAQLLLPRVPSHNSLSLIVGFNLLTAALVWLYQIMGLGAYAALARRRKEKNLPSWWGLLGVALLAAVMGLYIQERNSLFNLILYLVLLAAGLVRMRLLKLDPAWLRGSLVLEFGGAYFMWQAGHETKDLAVLLPILGGYMLACLAVQIMWEELNDGKRRALFVLLAALAASLALISAAYYVTVATLIFLFICLGSLLRRYVFKLPLNVAAGIILYHLAFIFFSLWNSESSGSYILNRFQTFNLLAHLLVAMLAHVFWSRLAVEDWRQRCLVVMALFFALWLCEGPYRSALFLQTGLFFLAWMVWHNAQRLKQLADKAGKPLAKFSKKLLRKASPDLASADKARDLAARKLGLLAKFMRQSRVKKVLAGLAGAAVLWGIGILVYPLLFTYVESFTPQGLVNNPNTVIRARFSGPVEITPQGLQDAITIEPSLPGSTRLEDSTTLVFTPSAPLKPATRYLATLKTSGLKAKSGFLQWGSKAAFFTEPFHVAGCRLFYTYDLVKEVEKQLVGELEFNYPVDAAQLRQALTVFKGSQALAPVLEQGSLPNRFFFRAGGIQREEERQVLVVKIAKGLPCVDGTDPLASEYVGQIELQPKPKLTVQEIKLHHKPGTSLISIRFSLPVSAAQVRQRVSIQPSLPFTVETEYTYAVLKAEFKPNLDYKIRVETGIRAVSGEEMKTAAYEQTLRLQDVPPFVRFADSGQWLPLDGPMNLGVKTMNLDKFGVNVEKVYRNNLVQFIMGRGTYGLGTSVYSGEVEVKGGQINEEVQTTINLARWQSARYKGLFMVRLTGEGAGNGGNDGEEGDEEEGGYRGRNSEDSSRWFQCTDLGLVAKRSGNDLWVQVLSISSLKPLSGVRLELVSQSNQTMQEKTTDEQGRAIFTEWSQGEENQRPLLLTAQKGEDFSFLQMERAGLPQERFDVSGDPISTDRMEAFLTSDRGLYRPGDTANFTAIVRQHDLKLPPDLPLVLTVRSGDGKELAKLAGKLQAGGLEVFELPLKADMPTGEIHALLGLENGVNLASTSIKVEEFIPNKIKVDVESQKKRLAAGEGLTFTVRARQLFGAPAANLKVKSWVEFTPKEFSHPAWPGYRFSDASRPFSSQTLRLPQGATDDTGAMQASLMVPVSLRPASMLQALVWTEVYDTGGRPVGGNASFDVHRWSTYFGLKSEKSGSLAPGKPVRIQYVAVTPDGKPDKASGVILKIKRRVWFSIFREQGWRGRGFDSSYYDQVVEGREMDVKGKGSITFTPDKAGEYTVSLGNEETMRTSLTLNVSGPGEQPGEAVSLETPEKLSLGLDKADYQPGENARVEVRAPFAGRLLLTVEREKVFVTRSLEIPAGTSQVEVPVEAGWLPNAYVVALLTRLPKESQRKLPMVSFGITPLKLDTSSRVLKLEWEAPATVRSRDGVSLSLKVEGGPGAKVVLAAVDEGILQVANFASPDPFKYFYRKRGLTTNTWCLFQDVLPNLDQLAAVGGDEEGGFTRRHLNPIQAKRVKSLAFFSGILTAGPDGKVEWKISTKAFHGDIRIMAMAVDGSRFGAGSRHVQVADSVVLEPSFPRFLAPGDTIDVPVQVFNRTSRRLDLKVKFIATGPVAVDGAAEKDLSLRAEGQARLQFNAKALHDAGVATFKVEAVDDKGDSYFEETELAVRPATSLRTDVRYGEIRAGGRQDLDVPGGFIPQGQKLRLVVSSSPLLTFLRSLDYLLSYPYGCAEQITSQAFPLLYFKDMGLLTGRFGNRAGAVARNVQDVIDRLSRMQRPDGGFTFWEGGDESNAWLSNYVSHFLLEAEKQGYRVPPAVMGKVKSRLGGIQVQGRKGRLDRRQENIERQDSAYILYLRALAGQPDPESMAAMREKNLAARSNTERCLLSLAYSAQGDRATARQVLPPTFHAAVFLRSLGRDLDSPNRELALYLLALSQCDPGCREAADVVIEFGKRMKDGHFGSTQENAWVFMALGNALKSKNALDPLQAEWALAGEAGHALSGDTAVVEDKKLAGRKVTLSNKGSQSIYYYLMSEGTPLEEKPGAVSSGLEVRREYRDERGSSVNLGAVTQGQLVVVTLDVTCHQEVDNLVLADLLPAGFEVDNPRLKSRGSLGFDPEESFSPESMDFRDDRVLLFTGPASGRIYFSYSVRAVTPGRYKVPGLIVEAMYNPEVFGRDVPADYLVVAPNKF